MKVYAQSDKTYFGQLFERKKELINKLLSIGIDHEKYFLMVTAVLKSDSVQKEFARLDLLLLRDKHNMDKQAWFEELVGQTQMTLTQQ